MKITVKATDLDLTPSLKIYIEEKLGALARFVKGFDERGTAELWVEVARLTRHHKHGDVFMAEVDLKLPKRVLRAVSRNNDVREAIDVIKKMLKMEIDKYKAKASERPVRREKKAV